LQLTTRVFIQLVLIYFTINMVHKVIQRCVKPWSTCFESI